MKITYLLALLCVPVCVRAQITIRWDAEPSKRSVSCPASSTSGKLRVRITNLNDVIYGHAVETTAVATAVYPPVPAGFNAAGDPSLKTARDAVNRLLAKYEPGFVPALRSGKFANLAVTATKSAWAEVLASSDWGSIDDTLRTVNAVTPATEQDAAEKKGILADIDKLKKAERAVAAADARGHVLETTVDIDFASKNVVKSRITQTFGGSPVENGEQEFTCTIDSGAFTLSLGPIFSQLQARQYSSQAVPNATGAGTSNVLAVQYGSSYRAAGAALINFAIPRASRGGLALFATTGPTIKSAADSTSSFGWFAGVSVALHKLLYVTPGFHYGEFADFPLGYAPGTSIPSSAPALTPLKRQSWRFGFAISIRTASFAKTEQKTPEVGAQPAAAPADKAETTVAAPAVGGGGLPGGLPAGSGEKKTPGNGQQ